MADKLPICEKLRDHAGDLTVFYARAVPKDMLTEAADTITALYGALCEAREWLSGWASAEPYITAIDAVLAQARGGPNSESNGNG